MHRFVRHILVIGGLLFVAALTATYAYGSSASPSFQAESAASMGVPSTGPNAIDPKTCRFLHRERDVVTNVGSIRQKLAANGRYDIAEDARHDAKLNCLTNLVRTLTKRVGTPASLHYVRVVDESTGATATATCPAGYVVTGGGSPGEVEGSWSPTPNSWTVHRDHLSPATMVVEALCVRVG